MSNEASLTAAKQFWTRAGRLLVFLLAATSIGCLFAEFYRLCPMRVFTLSIFLPALTLLLALALADRFWGERQLWRGVMIGVGAGLIAAIAYDAFRLPFVFAKEWAIDWIVPPMNLFKVFPRFGALILAQPIEQRTYSGAADLVGWAYHFSNSLTFGVMFVAMLGEAARSRWMAGVAMAVGLELGMLLTPYPNVFGIPVTATFVGVTMSAHFIFGVAMGERARWMARRWRGPIIRPVS